MDLDGFLIDKLAENMSKSVGPPEDAELTKAAFKLLWGTKFRPIEETSKLRYATGKNAITVDFFNLASCSDGYQWVQGTAGVALAVRNARTGTFTQLGLDLTPMFLEYLREVGSPLATELAKNVATREVGHDD